MKREFAGRSHVGRVRARNEDAILQRPDRGLFAVADGMGGHAGGDVASRIAVDVVDELTARAAGDPGAQLEAAIHSAHTAILKAARADAALTGMGTTFTALWLRADNTGGVIAHVGDSRAYRYRDQGLTRLTRDQTWVQMQVDAGVLSEDQARRHPYAAMLTCALGIEDVDLEVQVSDVDCRHGDLFLLCTDGLLARLGDHDLPAILGGDSDLDPIADALIDRANAAGGPDNISVALIRMGSRE